ncbi:hypothetical protein [Cohnella faecalis]|uniref:Uncharacterized protein n=1 Tax=Cohnella faecalis TaxID=2315694 RepID=A0A398CFJ2_9BACL|nr:hypothetical protein [Cohnella faecalis]RIE01493.1 hypothetical protein D3H35_24375 [Cohnella faecalis]
MTLSRTLTGLLILIGLALFCYAVPTFYLELRDHCIGQECAAYYDEPPTMEWLTERGLTPSFFAAAYTSLYSLFGLCYIAAGLVIFSKRSSGFAGQVASVALVLQGLTFDSLSLALEGIHPALDFLLRFVNAIAFVALILLFFIFPNGRFEPRWSRWLLVGILVPGLLKTAFPDSPVDMSSWSQPLYIGWVMIWMSSIIAIQIHRYRSALGAIEKQQTKWAVFGMASAIAILMAVTVFYIAQEDKLQNDPLLLFAMETLLSLGMLLIPVTLLFALLRRRLWDIDPIVNRTLVYSALSLFAVAVYVFVVWYIGVVFHSAGQWQWLNSLIATGLVAVLFAPLKDKLQRWINRLMYGENDDPLTVLGRLGPAWKIHCPPPMRLTL